ncbi:hypothetical protein [Streptomyces sp. F001]|uniref:type II toxin-antitoxin system RelE family toxin n=1 Tax=Streptomyces sp. F001 TaxID=1510026 RepID=UPI0019D1CE56|nr:hypothetical protein [Streptomyces sp. F001]
MPGTLWTVSESVFAKLAFDEFVHSAICSLRAITSLTGAGDRRVACPVEDRQLIVRVLSVGNHRDVHRQLP